MIKGFNETLVDNIPDLVARILRGLDNGVLKSGLWQNEEHACILGAVGPNVTKVDQDCLAFVGDLWMRELILMAYDRVSDDARDAATRQLCAALLKWSANPNYLAQCETIRHKFAGTVVLPRALLHFNHADYPEIKSIIDAKIDLHRRALAGEDLANEFATIEERAAGAVWAAGAARPARAARAARTAAAIRAAVAIRAAGAAEAAWAAWAAEAAEWSIMLSGFCDILAASNDLTKEEKRN